MYYCKSCCCSSVTRESVFCGWDELVYFHMMLDSVVDDFLEDFFPGTSSNDIDLRLVRGVCCIFIFVCFGDECDNVFFLNIVRK